jgi:hypothetical protein
MHRVELLWHDYVKHYCSVVPVLGRKRMQNKHEPDPMVRSSCSSLSDVN